MPHISQIKQQGFFVNLQQHIPNRPCDDSEHSIISTFDRSIEEWETKPQRKIAQDDQYFEMLIQAVAKHAHQQKEMSKRCAAATFSERVRRADELADSLTLCCAKITTATTPSR